MPKKLTRWTEEEKQFVINNCHAPIKKIVIQFCELFERQITIGSWKTQKAKLKRKGKIKPHPLESLTEDILLDLYGQQEMGYDKIGELFQCSGSTIHNHLTKHGITKAVRYVGKKFGKLTVTERGGLSSQGLTQWICNCDCGESNILVAGYNLRTGNTKTCGCSRTTLGNNNPLFKGYKEISGRLWTIWKNGAKARNLQFNITIEYMWDLFIEQNRKCALTDLPICFAESNSKNGHGYRTASPDRIDSACGYIPENMQWIHKDINRMKWDLDEQYFITLCRLITIKDNNNGQ